MIFKLIAKLHLEKSRSWPSAHDWKSCIPQKGIEGSNPSFSANKKVSFVYQTKETFLRDAFLAERDAHCVRDAASPVMHAFGA